MAVSQTEPEESAFVAKITAQRAADGQPEFITEPSVYRILDGLLARRETTPTDPRKRAERRRRAIERSRSRVPYTG